MLGQLFFADQHVQLSIRNVEFDQISGLHKRQRTADMAFRRDMQHAGSVRGSAHARVRNSDHIADALFQQLFRNRQYSPFGHHGPVLAAVNTPGLL